MSLSGSLMCVSVSARMSMLWSLMILMMECILPASRRPVVFQVPIRSFFLLGICVSSLCLLVVCECSGLLCVDVDVVGEEELAVCLCALLAMLK